MNKKIQDGIGLITAVFTKRIGEVGVYAGLDIVLTFLASLPMIIIFRGSFAAVGAPMDISTLTHTFSPEMFQLAPGFGDLLKMFFEYLLPVFLGAIITLVLMTAVVSPILTIVRLTFITSGENSLAANINLAIKTLKEKIAKLITLFVYFAIAYIAVFIAVFVLLLVFMLIGVVGLYLLWLVFVVGGILAFYFLTPVILLAPIDALMTDKPVMACIMDAFNAKVYRTPMFVIVIVINIATSILGQIFLRIPVPMLFIIVTASLAVCQTCIVLPWYKEYAGLEPKA